MAASKESNYSVLLKFLQEQIDLRYKAMNTGPWRDRPAVTDHDMDHGAQNDDWFNLNRALAMKEVQAALKSFCALKRRPDPARDIERVLKCEFNSINSDRLFRMRRLYIADMLADLIFLFQASSRLKTEKNKGGRPGTAKELARLLDKVAKELKCSPTDSAIWPTFHQRAEEKYLTIPGHRGFGKHRWTKLQENDLERAHATVIRYHRQYN